MGSMILLVITFAVAVQLIISEVRYPSFLEIVNRHCRLEHYPASRFDVNDSALVSLIDSRIQMALTPHGPRTCRDTNQLFARSHISTSGISIITRPGIEPMEVYCDMTTDGGGWTVCQRRMDGSVDFEKNWHDYANGFGNKRGEFWLGLENIYKLTTDGVYELRVDMVDRNGEHYYAKYSSFSIESALDNYRLRVRGYTGNATDSLSYHNDQPFTTYDNENDNDRGGNCASYFKGAWWHKACYYSHLNGQFTGSDLKAFQWWYKINPTGWSHPSRPILLQFSEMKFRKTR